MLSKILVPVDGSKDCLRALDHGIHLAKKTDASITLMHVMEEPPSVYMESRKVLNDILANFRTESQNILEKCKQIASRSDVKVETVIGQGDAASQIVGYAHDGDFDTLILCKRGLGTLEEIVLGSASNKVLHHAKCSSMMTK
jgi:nucleotide-binding universal stress UspA family protein